MLILSKTNTPCSCFLANFRACVARAMFRYNYFENHRVDCNGDKWISSRRCSQNPCTSAGEVTIRMLCKFSVVREVWYVLYNVIMRCLLVGSGHNIGFRLVSCVCVSGMWVRINIKYRVRLSWLNLKESVRSFHLNTSLLLTKLINIWWLRMSFLKIGMIQHIRTKQPANICVSKIK